MRKLDPQLQRIIDKQEESDALLRRIDAALVVRDPGSARSADAFEGLRRAVIQASTQRRAHISHLLTVLDAVNNGATTEMLEMRITDLLSELGVFAVRDPAQQDLFNPTDGEVSDPEVVEPAWIQMVGEDTSHLIRKGEVLVPKRHSPSASQPEQKQAEPIVQNNRDAASAAAESSELD